MKKSIVILIILALLSSLLTACGHEHVWAEATCTTAKTCSECGETEGVPIGHDAVPANCEAPETCSRCGESFGTKLDHEWQEATCAAPKTCTSCGLTMDKPLDHIWGNHNYKTAECTECGKVTPFISVIQDFYPIGDTSNIDSETGELTFSVKEFLSTLMFSDSNEYNILSADTSEGTVYFLMEDPDPFTTYSGSSIDSIIQDSLLQFYFQEADTHKMIHHKNTSSKINMICINYPLSSKNSPVITPFLYDLIYQINPSCSFYTFNQYFEELDDDLDFIEAITGTRGYSKMDMGSNLAYQYYEDKEDDLVILVISSLTAFNNDF